MKSDFQSRQDFSVPVTVRETAGIARRNEPVRVGLPLPRGLVSDGQSLGVYGPDASPLLCQCRALAHWPDGSVKWALLDALVAIGANEQVALTVKRRPSDKAAAADGFDGGRLQVTEEARCIRVDTGAARFSVASDVFAPLQSVVINSVDVLAAAGSQLRLRAVDGADYVPVIDAARVEESGPVRVALRLEGGFARDGRRIPLRFLSRILFHADSTRVRMEIRIRNPQAARHPGGLWDLGDAGSLSFSDLSLRFFPRSGIKDLRWYAEHPRQSQRSQERYFTLYQDSSGGENWDSPNHVDGSGRLTVAFPGYRVSAGPSQAGVPIGAGRRASPGLQTNADTGWIAIGIEDFWQNFPKALRVADGVLSVGLFPSECDRGFELQGGEQKRHVVLLDFGTAATDSAIPAMQAPLTAQIDPVWIERSQAIAGFVAEAPADMKRYFDYVGAVVEGPNSFFAKREVIDEYGWRNYGDVYADHEAVRHRGSKPLVAHYNNQYDFVYASLVHHLRTGDVRWRRLMEDAARHTIDIDIYHTDADRPAYNRGLFWHTDHYMDAATCTHRTYSRRNAVGAYGGGPSNEHNYTTGLLHYYYLTGDPEAAAAVRELADWVKGMDDGALTLLAFLDDGPTGAASQTASTDYHKPGRGAGNSINALLDAHALTGERAYFAKAEELIRRCIHPRDEIAALKLDEPEYRWSYLVFLQVLGKYLDVKAEWGEHDYGFYYAQASLLHYADWMAHHEVPYRDVLHKVLIPTETWPAQDIRKCHVFHLAAQHAPAESRARYREKAKFFFERCLDDVLSFETAFVTRPLVILSAFGYFHAYFQKYPESGNDPFPPRYDFGQPEEFLPQRKRIKRVVARKFRAVVTEIKRMSSSKWQEVRQRF